MSQFSSDSASHLEFSYSRPLEVEDPASADLGVVRPFGWLRLARVRLIAK